MYDWLQSTINDSTCVVTANRRLARELQRRWSALQVEAGVRAWRTPNILPWDQWLGQVVATARAQDALPTRINAHQSQVLWERCLRKELGEDTTGLPSLVRMARDTWQRLADARVSIREVARAAQTVDHRLFAAAAGRYLAVLENEHWIDDAGLAAFALDVVESGAAELTERYVFVGFDRERASLNALREALAGAGSEISVQEPVDHGSPSEVLEYEDRDAELRSAGAWARSVIADNPNAAVAIVVQGLDQTAARDLHLVREGFVPGWQYGPPSLASAVNISYGQRLSDYPAVRTALLALRWLVSDLSAREVASLLQSPFIGAGDLAVRARLELKLRELPDRAWAPSMLTSALRGKNDANAEEDWLARVASITKTRRELKERDAPASWVENFNDYLRLLGWPGPGTLDSNDYQLINRWRELYNDFARLDLVSASMSASAAVSQLERMASETLFQPESRGTAVQLMGPLEASGAEFDAIWVAGLTASNWPQPGNPSALVSRALQVEHGMPHATPEDTRTWARTTLTRLTGAAPRVVCSYALLEDDVAQTVSDLLGEIRPAVPRKDPGWHAVSLTEIARAQVVRDTVPGLEKERVFGGAATVQRQLSEPFSAFAFGRLGIRSLDSQAQGIPALLRGNLVHDTMFRLYQGLPSAADLRRMSDEELATAAAEAADGALQRHQRNTDRVLRQLLQLERERIVSVVSDFVRKDAERGEFQVAALEGSMEFRHGPLRLSLRFDRIDRYDDDSIGIIDYKTGAAKSLLSRDGSVREAQLFVYSLASSETVAMLALANLDSRDSGFSGAGRGFTDEAAWPELLASIGAEIATACDDLIAGDVRLVAEQGAASARRLNVLSRYTELRRDG